MTFRLDYLCISLTLFLCVASSVVSRADGLSTGELLPNDLLLSSDGSVLYVLESGAERLHRVFLKENYRGDTLSLGFSPERMTWFPDHHRIAIVGSGVDGKLAIVSLGEANSGPMKLEKVIEVGHTPSDVAVGPNAKGEPIVYVSNRFSGTVSVVNALSGKVVTQWSVGREPYAMKITPDGSLLIIASLLPENQADMFYTMSLVRVIETKTGKIDRIEMLNGVSGQKDLAISPDGKYAFITGTQGNYQTVTSQVVGGWIVENIISVVDIQRREAVETVFLDDTLLGAGNPWGITFSDDGQFLIVAIAGTDEIMFMPMSRISKILSARPQGNRPGAGAYTYTYHGQGKTDFPFRLRVRHGLKGTRRIVSHGLTVYGASRFEDAVAVVTLQLTPPFENYEGSFVKMGDLPKQVGTAPGPGDTKSQYPRSIELESISPLKGINIQRHRIQLAARKEWSLERRGEVLFHDANLCMEHWLSCVTCHPDARMDGLNWDLVNDGVGNPKNTKSMFLSHETPPSMITGVRKDAETAVRSGVTHLLFSFIPESDSVAMDEYLRNLKQVPSPRLIKGELNPSAKRGRFLFESSRTNCSTCHPEPLFTDLNMHTIHSQDIYDTHSEFDTPTLREVWRTAPYMNTGHYKTIKELLIQGKHGNMDGLLNKLTSQELDDLVEYVLSL